MEKDLGVDEGLAAGRGSTDVIARFECHVGCGTLGTLPGQVKSIHLDEQEDGDGRPEEVESPRSREGRGE